MRLVRQSAGGRPPPVGNVTTCMTNNALFPNMDPPLLMVIAALVAYKNALAAQVNGGKDRRNAVAVARANLVSLMRLLALYVQRTANGNMEVLLSSGFPICKPQRQPVGILPAPGSVTLVLGDRSGDLKAATPRMNGATGYNWILSTVANPGVAVQTASTPAARTTFSGLTPGVLYQVTVSAVGSSGPSDWSDAATQMAV